MAAKANNNDKASNANDEVSTGGFPSCGPGCDCVSPASKTSRTAKIVICCAVVAIIAGILLFKAMNARQNPAAGLSASFAQKGPVTNSSAQVGGSGAAISAIADLNDLAAKLDTVFLVIPGKDNAPATKETGAVLASVERTLNEKGLSTGIYTLKATSPDYPDVAAKVTPPGIAVLTKGRGIGFVSGGMSENKLMQAYVASTSGGGCGPSGCPPPGGGKAAVPCN
ncbi:hypothetical protein OR1_00557 [Geobacter sp. OR-1]|uniref:hypothetical protein n=1 Tax=Geobacter sp. OR-1 TaxID=1266765 RepID=UPI0005425CB5|nr:hypothetical protein [Geobacter sp. OR-1]GAM08286.1 hypothetical protein OR1_00557 [Geobacter sp. OR-1]